MRTRGSQILRPALFSVLFCVLLSLGGGRRSLFRIPQSVGEMPHGGAGILTHPKFGDKITCVSLNSVDARPF